MPIYSYMGKVEFVEIDLDIIRIDTILGIDLYLKVPQGYVLYRSCKVPFNERVRRNLLSHGVTSLYIQGKEVEKFNDYLENNLSNIISDPQVKTEAKRQLVYDSSLNIARELIQNPTSISTVRRSSKVVENMVDLHLHDDDGFKKLVELMPSDYQIFSHSANVSTYSIALGKSLGLFNKTQLYELGLGAFLHDIGKSRIPKAIVNKPGSLTNDEFNKMKEHVLKGLKIAEKIPVVPKNALYPILFHHERMSGKGYPSGKMKDEIHIYGLITAVADAFDAMTTNRVYQDAQPSYDVLSKLISSNDSYDLRIVMEMVKLLGPDEKVKELQVDSPVAVI